MRAVDREEALSVPLRDPPDGGAPKFLSLCEVRLVRRKTLSPAIFNPLLSFSGASATVSVFCCFRGPPVFLRQNEG